MLKPEDEVLPKHEARVNEGSLMVLTRATYRNLKIWESCFGTQNLLTFSSRDLKFSSKTNVTIS